MFYGIYHDKKSSIYFILSCYWWIVFYRDFDGFWFPKISLFSKIRFSLIELFIRAEKYCFGYSQSRLFDFDIHCGHYLFEDHASNQLFFSWSKLFFSLTGSDYHVRLKINLIWRLSIDFDIQNTWDTSLAQRKLPLKRL